ncbi:MAG: InlB B-repeat-containing protein [Oscillospiraceae bacterium]|nr:InlB B-repeat-containing protein [Oscillospiraceae bacterium]
MDRVPQPAAGTIARASDDMGDYRYAYTLAGWYRDEEFTQPYNFGKAVVSDLTLYAKWTRAASFGTVVEVTDADVLYAMSDFTRSGAAGASLAGTMFVLQNDIVLTKPWTPTGIFAGTFDGGGYEISGLAVAGGTATYQGFFGTLNNAAVKNLTLSGQVAGGNYTGGVAGQAAGAVTFTNVISNVTVTGAAYVGGILGHTPTATASGGAVTFAGCENAGAVTGSSYVGGLAGYTAGLLTITDSGNTGAVKGTYAGGLAGNPQGGAVIAGSYNGGTITGQTGGTGGLVGYLAGGTGVAASVTDSHNTGAVSGAGTVGGLIGYTGSASGGTTITGSYNTGTITSSAGIAGGIAGAAGYSGAGYITAVARVYNTGSVINTAGTGAVGGLFGTLAGGAGSSFSDSYNAGTVTNAGTGATGGIAGTYTLNGASSDVRNAANVTGGGITGGLFGQFAVAYRLSKSVNTGNVASTASYAGGLIGNASTAAITVGNCLNSGAVSGSVRGAGITGNGTGAAAAYTNVLNTGTVSGGTTYRFKFSYQGIFINCYTVESCAGANPADAEFWYDDEEFGVWYPGWDVKLVSGGALTDGELACELDGGDGDRLNLWVQGASAPEFVSDTNHNFIYKVVVPAQTPNGTVTVGSAYNASGNNVAVTAAPAAGKERLSFRLMDSTAGKPVPFVRDGDVFAFTMPAANVIVEARFGSLPTGEYTVTFEYGNGAQAAQVTVNGDTGYKVAKPSDPSRDGKAFGGWYLGSREFDFDTVITGDITLAAHWKGSADDIEVTLHFDVPGRADEYAATDGDGKIAPADPVRDAPGPYDEYRFTGWYTVGGVYVDIAQKVFTSDAELYAHWGLKDLFEEYDGAAYEFTTEEQLREFASRVSGTNEDTARFPKSYAGKTFVLKNDIELTGEWTPVGKAAFAASGAVDAAASRPFAGTFDGGGFTISGLQIGSLTSRAAGDFNGLFGYATGAVRNLNVEGAVYAGGDYTGGVVGYTTATLTNVTFAKPQGGAEESAGVVSSTGKYTGGIAGYASGVLTDCVNYGAVAGGNYVGGIAGALANAAEIKPSAAAPAQLTANYGTVRGASYVGGIAGSGFDAQTAAANAIRLTRIVNEGAVTGTVQYIGGLIGGGKGCIVTFADCANNADVAGSSYVGGLAGAALALYTTGTTGYNVNNGAVAGGPYTGGAVGYIAAHFVISATDTMIPVEFIANTGSVSGTRYVGGTVGYLDGLGSLTVQFCWSTGGVTGNSAYNDISGLIGYTIRGFEAKNLYATGKVVNGGAGRLAGVINGSVTGAQGTYKYILYCNGETPLVPVVSGGTLSNAYTYCYYYAPDGAITGANAVALSAEDFRTGRAMYLLGGGAAHDNSYWTFGGGDGSLPFRMVRAATAAAAGTYKLYQISLAPLAADSRLSVLFGESAERASVRDEYNSQYVITDLTTGTLPLTVTVADAGEGDTPRFTPAGAVTAAAGDDGETVYSLALTAADRAVTHCLDEDKYSDSWYSDAGTAFTLYSESQLRVFAELVTSGKTFYGKTVTLGNDIALTQPWIPAGTVVLDAQGKPDAANSRVFSGVFDGANHTISGLTIGSADEPFAGNGAAFIAAAARDTEFNGDIIKNLKFTDVNIYSTGDYAGTAAGYTRHYTNNVTVTKAHITGRNYVGGVIGRSDNIYNGSINDIVFGAAGDGSTVTATGDYAGGLVGRAENYPTGAAANVIANYGAVTGRDYVGGLTGAAGYPYAVKANAGDVSGRNYVGGIAGYAAPALAASLYFYITDPTNTVYINSGDITATGDYAGGVVGFVNGNLQGYTTQAYPAVLINSGAVSAAKYAGGMYGAVSGAIPKMTVATSPVINNLGTSVLRTAGTVTAEDYAGGFIGAAGSAYLNHWANTAAVTATGGTHAGGLLGGITAADGYAEFVSCFDTVSSALTGAAGAVYTNCCYTGAAGTAGLMSAPLADFTSGRVAWRLQQGEGVANFLWTDDGVTPVRAIGTRLNTRYYRIRLTDPDTRANMADTGYIALPGSLTVYDDGLSHEVFLKQAAAQQTFFSTVKPGFAASFTPASAVAVSAAEGGNVYRTAGTVTADLDIKYNVGKSVAAEYGWYTGADPALNAYEISTEAELIGFGSLVNGTAPVGAGGALVTQSFAGKTVKLAEDIAMVSANFTPVGTAAKPFRGVFDGQSKKITGLYISAGTTAAAPNAGLFGCADGAEIKNLNVSGSVSATGAAGSVGGVIGLARSTNLTNVTFGAEGDGSAVSFTAAAAQSNAGGIAGAVYFAANQTVVFKDCVNYGAINVTSAAAGVYSGGIAARADTTSGAANDTTGALVFDNCVNRGAVNMRGTAAAQTFAAGIVCANERGATILLNCKNYGAVTTDNAASGIFGAGQQYKPGSGVNYGGKNYNYNLYIYGCENNGAITGGTAAVGGAYTVFGVTRIESFVNNGAITVNGDSGIVYADGAMSIINISGAVTDVTLINVTNYGEILVEDPVSARTLYVGGIASVGAGVTFNGAARSLVLEDCVNYGGITVRGTPNGYGQTNRYIAGVLNANIYLYNTATLTLTRCGNYGGITVTPSNIFTLAGYGKVAGFAVIPNIYAAAAPVITGCFNAGDVSVAGAGIGDLAGLVLTGSGIQGTLRIKSSFNTGAITGGMSYGLTNITKEGVYDRSYTTAAGTLDTSAANLWTLPVGTAQFAGTLNLAAGCADLWTYTDGEPVPVYADGTNGVRSFSVTATSVNKNGEPVQVAGNAVSVSGAERAADGMYYAQKSANLTLNFSAAGDYVLSLLTVADAAGVKLYSDSNIESMAFPLEQPVLRVTAVFREKTSTGDEFTVAFDLNGAEGDAPETQTVAAYGKAEAVADPARSQHLFLGWYTAASGGGKWDFGAAVMDDMTLYAHWLDGFEARLDLNYGGLAPETQLVSFGQRVTQPEAPARPNAMNGTTEVKYTFLGWFTEASGGDEWNFAETVGRDDARLAAGDPIPTLTLYAHWAYGTDYLVTYNLNYAGADPTVTYGYNYGAKIPKPEDPVRPPLTADGKVVAEFEFAGWWHQHYTYNGSTYSNQRRDAYDFDILIADEYTVRNHVQSTGTPLTIALYATWREVEVLFEGETVEITSAEELQALAEAVDTGGDLQGNTAVFAGKTFIITQDIVIDGSVWNPPLNTVPAASGDSGFAGTLTALPGVTVTLLNMRRPLFYQIGASGTVDGLTLSGDYTSVCDQTKGQTRVTAAQGLFAAINRGTIKNCALVDVHILMLDYNPAKNNAQLYFAGGLVGVNNGLLTDITAENSSVECKLVFPYDQIASGTFFGVGAGMIVGQSGTTLINITVTDCSVIATDFGKAQNSDITSASGGILNTTTSMGFNAYHAFGGIAGQGNGAEGCVNENTTVSGGWTAGGIYGWATSSNDITDCENSGNISSYFIAGGIVGVQVGSIYDSKNTGEVSLVDSGPTLVQSALGGIAGVFNSTFSSVVNCVNGEPGQVIVIPDRVYNYGGILGGGMRNRNGMTSVTDCVNYASFVDSGSDGERFQGNIGGIVGGGAAVITRCANLGDIILPDAKDTGGIGGGEMGWVQTDSLYFPPAGLEPGKGVSSGNGVSYTDPTAVIRNCVFYGSLVTADGASGGGLAGGPARGIHGSIWIDKSGETANTQRKLAADYITLLRYSGAEPIGAFDSYYAIAGVESAPDTETAKFVPWSLIESGEFAWLLDGGEDEHTGLWTQDEVPLPQNPTVWRLNVTVEFGGESAAQTLYLRADQSYAVPQIPPLVFEEDGKRVTITYEPVIELVNAELEGGAISPTGNGSAVIRYAETRAEEELPVAPPPVIPSPEAVEPEPEPDGVIVEDPPVPGTPGDGEGDGIGGGDGEAGGDGSGTGTGTGDGNGASSQGETGNPPGAAAIPNTVDNPERNNDSRQTLPDPVIDAAPDDDTPQSDYVAPPEITPPPREEPEPTPEPPAEEPPAPTVDEDPEHEQSLTTIQKAAIVAGSVVAAVAVGVGGYSLVIKPRRRKTK